MGLGDYEARQCFLPQGFARGPLIIILGECGTAVPIFYW